MDVDVVDVEGASEDPEKARSLLTRTIHNTHYSQLLKLRRASGSERKKYFDGIEKRREAASEEQEQKWGWQKKQYKKGEDPINEWRKRRASGQISDLENQYGDPKNIGGIPLPSASFGVGGEFGVGGKFDNGGR